ncbi:LytR/AlgR family response regulator transcription factor [Ekhidna sp.]
MKLKALLIDDEQHCLDTLSYDLETHCSHQVDIQGTSKNTMEATAQINKVKPDLIFLDIELPGMNGIEFLESIGELDSKLVFTTAYSQYALEGYKHNASGYLLKPIDKEELIKIVSKLYAEKKNDQSIFNDRLTIKDAQGTEFIKLSDIRLCEASNNYTIIHLTAGDKKTVSKTLKAVQSELPTNQFVRIHQSYLINMQCVKKYLRMDGGTIELDNGEQYRLSKGYRESFLSMIQ